MQNLRDHVQRERVTVCRVVPDVHTRKQFFNAADFKRITDSSAPDLQRRSVHATGPVARYHRRRGGVRVHSGAGRRPEGRAVSDPRRPQQARVLAKVIERLNEIQLKSKELKGSSSISTRARRTPSARSRTAVRLLLLPRRRLRVLRSEADIKAVIDRDKTAAKDKTPELVGRMTKLGVADAAVVLLVNPRALDAELAAKVKSAKPDEKRSSRSSPRCGPRPTPPRCISPIGTDVGTRSVAPFDPGEVARGAEALAGRRSARRRRCGTRFRMTRSSRSRAV